MVLRSSAAPLRSLLIAVALIGAACGSDDGRPSSDACGPPVTEALDPASGLHVVRPDEVTFDDLTPTSGPHLSVLGPAGSVDATIAQAAQVALLEQGGVVISVADDQDATRAELSALGGERVLVHPIDGLPDPVVITAWRTRVTCDSADLAYAEWFIDTYVGRPDLAPGQHDE